MRILSLLAASVAVGAFAVPAIAQQPYPYSQPVPQPYPGQPGYGYQQPGSNNPIEQLINSLLGNNNRYTVSDRTAVTRCASAAIAEAERRYRPNRGYGQAYGYNPQYGQPNAGQYGYNNGYAPMRVTSITDVQRRSYNRLSVTGLISSGAYAAGYGNQGYDHQGYRDGQRYADPRYADPRYAQAPDISFRCMIDSRGTVTSVRLNRNTAVAYRR